MNIRKPLPLPHWIQLLSVIPTDKDYKRPKWLLEPTIKEQYRDLSNCMQYHWEYEFKVKDKPGLIIRITYTNTSGYQINWIFQRLYLLTLMVPYDSMTEYYLCCCLSNIPLAVIER